VLFTFQRQTLDYTLKLPGFALFQLKNGFCCRQLKTCENMRSSTSTVLLVIVLLLTFPVWIGIAGAIFGVAVGVVGGIFGAIAGVFGAIFGLIGGLFGWIFDWSEQGIHFPFFFPTKIFVLAFLVLLILLISRSKKRAS
jgi:hypothetical protein